MNIDNPNGVTALTVDDSADSSPQNVTVTSPQITGLAPAPITYTAPLMTFSKLTIDGGSGGNSLTVASTPMNAVMIVSRAKG